jgi:2-polyprenyl-6-hydroxyphenyl methylase/3-demethylubiquinone-9 3-methyltransferase
VHSFDYDPQSVACTAELKRRYFPGDSDWTVEEASVLEREYLLSLGKFDVVYSWGVLHHTGRMWEALDNARLPVASGGKLFLAIYNDMGSQSVRWRAIKRLYNRLPDYLRAPFAAIVMLPQEGKSAVHSLLALKPGRYIHSWTHYSQRRGMSHWHDILDWVGGYPYDVAKPEEIFEYYKTRGFTLMRLKCGGVGLGCNEYVFLNDK